MVAQFDPALFGWRGAKNPNGSPVLGSDWFLLDAQVHKPHTDPELVEHGQMLAMNVDDWDDVYGDDEDDMDDDD